MAAHDPVSRLLIDILRADTHDCGCPVVWIQLTAQEREIIRAHRGSAGLPTRASNRTRSDDEDPDVVTGYLLPCPHVRAAQAECAELMPNFFDALSVLPAYRDRPQAVFATATMPHTQERVQVYRERVAAGLACFQPGDAGGRASSTELDGLATPLLGRERNGEREIRQPVQVDGWEEDDEEDEADLDELLKGARLELVARAALGRCA